LRPARDIQNQAENLPADILDLRVSRRNPPRIEIDQIVPTLSQRRAPTTP